MIIFLIIAMVNRASLGLRCQISDDINSAYCVPQIHMKAFSKKYKGRCRYTVNNNICVPWRTAIPLAKRLLDRTKYPFDADHSYCLATGHEREKAQGPWCFVRGKEGEGKRLLYKEPCFPTCESVREHNCFWFKTLPQANEFEYLGSKATTQHGRQCHPWPREYRINEAVCRSKPYWVVRTGPKQAHMETDTIPQTHRPWCFVDDQLHWDYCHPVCEELYGCVEPDIAPIWNYSGIRNISVSGLHCKYWSRVQSLPTPKSFDNHCINLVQSPVGPYCVTERKENDTFEPCFRSCNEEKYCFDSTKGVMYRGTRDVTLWNRSCVRWDSKELASLGMPSYTAKDFGIQRPSDIWTISNFCRNPDYSSRGPWCYVFVDKRMAKPEACFRRCSEEWHSPPTIVPEAHNITAAREKGRFGKGNWLATALMPLVLLGVFLSCVCCCACCIYCIRAIIEAYAKLVTCADRKVLEETKEFMEENKPGEWQRPDGRIETYTPTPDELEAWKNLKEEVDNLESYIKSRGLLDRNIIGHLLSTESNARRIIGGTNF